MTLLLQSSLKSKTVSHSSSEFAPGEMRFFGSAENADVSPRAFAPIEVKLKDGLQAGLQLDFDLYAGGELQGHQGVVRQDFRDLHSGLLCEKVPEYWEIIRCDFSKWML